VLGGGLDGPWSAVGADRKLDELGKGPDAALVTLVNCDRFQKIRVRDYEADVVVRGASWDFYDRMTDAIGDRSSVRIAFDGKDMELNVIGPVHEGRGNLSDMFVGEVCEGLRYCRRKPILVRAA
jgi:hypothetical protein